MENHSVVFKSETSGQFRVSGHLLLIDVTVLDKLSDPGRQVICLLDVAFIEFEMHFQSLIGYALKSTEIELPCLITAYGTHAKPPMLIAELHKKEVSSVSLWFWGLVRIYAQFV